MRLKYAGVSTKERRRVVKEEGKEVKDLESVCAKESVCCKVEYSSLFPVDAEITVELACETVAAWLTDVEENG